MTTIMDFESAIAANPRDVGLRITFGEWLEENPNAWRRTEEPCPLLWCRNNWKPERCVVCADTKVVVIDRTDWPTWKLPWWEQRVLWPWLLKWEDEREFGTTSISHDKGPLEELCDGCGHPARVHILNGGCAWSREKCECNYFREQRPYPTFALLLGRPGDEPCKECGGEGQVDDPAAPNDPERGVDCPDCSGSGKQPIPGLLSLLVRDLRAGGHPVAEELGKMGLLQVSGSWFVQGIPGRFPVYSLSGHLDALRELHQRVWRMLTEECSIHRTWRDANARCPECHGLGWNLRTQWEYKTVGDDSLRQSHRDRVPRNVIRGYPDA